MFSFGKSRKKQYIINNQNRFFSRKLPDDFEWLSYLMMNVDLIDNGMSTKEDAEQHWLQFGYNEKRNYIDNHSFDWRHYIIANPKLIEENIRCREDAYNHWIQIGRKEQYPTYDSNFNWKIYAAINPDLQENGIIDENNILEHWIYHGYNEGRAYKLIDFDWLFYIMFNCLYHEYITTETQAVLHWLQNGQHNNITHTTLNNSYIQMKNYDYSDVSPNINEFTQLIMNTDESNIHITCIDQLYLHDIVKRNTPIFRQLEQIVNVESYLIKYKSFILIVDFPCFGGGCSFFLNSIITKYKDNVDFLIVRSFNEKIHWYINDEQILSVPTTINDAIHFLDKIKQKIRKIFVNSIIGHQKVLLDRIMTLGIHVSVITHDFRLLFDNPHKYYYEMEDAIPTGILDLNKIDRLYTQNVGNLHTFGKYIDKNKQIIVSPLPDFKNTLNRVETNNTKTVIGVLGDISDVKGCILVYHIIKLIKPYAEKFELIVFGNINVPYVTKYPYTSIRHLNTLLETHKPNLWLETSLWPETYSYTLTLMRITRLPILYQNKFYNCAVQNRLKQYPSAFPYNSIDEVTLEQITSLKKNHFFTIDPIIYFPKAWNDFFTSYNINKHTYPTILNATNIAMITSKIYTTKKPFSYSSTRSIYTPIQRFEQTLDTINSIRTHIPNVIIVLFDNSEFPVEQYSLLEKSVDHFLNVTSNEIVNEYTNNSAHKIYGEIVQTYELLTFIEKTLHYKMNIQNVFKISGRYVLNEHFNYNKFDNDDIILKQNMNVIDRKYYYTCFYKFHYKCFDKIYAAVQTVYDGMKENKYGHKDWEVLLPQLLEYDIHEIETLGVTQNIAVWNDKSEI